MADRETNVEFLTRVMDFSQHGPLMQAFVLTGLLQYSRVIAKTDPMTLYQPGLNGVAWHGCAVELLAEVARHLGVPPQAPEQGGDDDTGPDEPTPPKPRKAAAKKPSKTAAKATPRGAVKKAPAKAPAKPTRKAPAKAPAKPARKGGKAQAAAARKAAPAKAAQARKAAPSKAAAARTAAKAPKTTKAQAKAAQAAVSKSMRVDEPTPLLAPDPNFKAEVTLIKKPAPAPLPPAKPVTHNIVRVMDDRGHMAKCSCGWRAREGKGNKLVMDARCETHLKNPQAITLDVVKGMPQAAPIPAVKPQPVKLASPEGKEALARFMTGKATAEKAVAVVKAVQTGQLGDHIKQMFEKLPRSQGNKAARRATVNLKPQAAPVAAQAQAKASFIIDSRGRKVPGSLKDGPATKGLAIHHETMGVYVGLDGRGKPKFSHRPIGDGLLFTTEDALLEAFVTLPEKVADGCTQVEAKAGPNATWHI